MADFYTIEPRVGGSESEVIFGDSRKLQNDVLLVGNLAERGPEKTAWIDVSGEHVIAIVGKRGTGKSHTLGVLLESLCLASADTKISRITDKRGVLLFDTLDIFWTSKFEPAETGPERVVEQFKLLKEWGLEPEKLAVDLWIPAGFKMEADPADVKTFKIDVSDLDAADFASLLEVDLVQEVRGQLINEAYAKTAIEGWRRGGKKVAPKSDFALADIIECVRYDDDIQADYQRESIRSVVQRLQAYSRYELMQGEGTPLERLVQPGRLTVLMLSRLSDDLRSVLAAVLIKKVMESRSRASFIAKRILTDPTLSKPQVRELEAKLANYVPRSWIAIDEAQNLIPSDRKTSAQETLVRLVKTGRNMGLSFIVTTQQPSAIDPRVMSQVDTLLSHQLTTRQDVDNVISNLKSAEPESITASNVEIGFPELLRSLGQGQAVVSTANQTPEVARAFVVNVRPRVSVHGGFEQ